MSEKLYNLKETYVCVDGKFDALVWEPDEPTLRSNIAIVSMHGGGNGRGGLKHNLLMQIARHGYRTMYAVPAHGDFVTQFGDLKAQVEWMRSQSGVDKLILLGHSRGASLISAYQAISECGSDIYNFPGRRVPFPKIDGLIPADGVMLTDANYGFMWVLCMNPAITDENGTLNLDPALDPTLPENGYNPAKPSYSADFMRRYQRGQAARYNRLLDKALARWELIKAGNGNYKDNEPFLLPDCYGGLTIYKPMAFDNRLLSHTRGEYPLLHADGSITNGVVHSVRGPVSDPREIGSYERGCFKTTVKEFLDTEVRIEDDFGYDEDHFWGIDWRSGMELVPNNVSHISVPLLIMGMTGGHEYLASEYIYENAASKDTTIAFTEGATHNFDANKDAEKYPGQFGDTVATTASYISGWLLSGGRFI